jgi:hypothetical protein
VSTGHGRGRRWGGPGPNTLHLRGQGPHPRPQRNSRNGAFPMGSRKLESGRPVASHWQKGENQKEGILLRRLDLPGPELKGRRRQVGMGIGRPFIMTSV